MLWALGVANVEGSILMLTTLNFFHAHQNQKYTGFLVTDSHVTNVTVAYAFIVAKNGNCDLVRPQLLNHHGTSLCDKAEDCRGKTKRALLPR